MSKGKYSIIAVFVMLSGCLASVPMSQQNPDYLAAKKFLPSEALEVFRSKYQVASPQRAFAYTEENESSKFAIGYGWGNGADRRALSECEKIRSGLKINAVCKIFAINNTIVWQGPPNQHAGCLKFFRAWRCFNSFNETSKFYTETGWPTLFDKVNAKISKDVPRVGGNLTILYPHEYELIASWDNSKHIKDNRSELGKVLEPAQLLQAWELEKDIRSSFSSHLFINLAEAIRKKELFDSVAIRQVSKGLKKVKVGNKRYVVEGLDLMGHPDDKNRGNITDSFFFYSMSSGKTPVLTPEIFERELQIKLGTSREACNNKLKNRSLIFSDGTVDCFLVTLNLMVDSIAAQAASEGG
jgi:hypothetical protein